MRPGIVTTSVIVAAGLAAASFLYRRPRSRGAGSHTNASDAVDDVQLRATPSTEEVMDAGVMHTFPASDPVAVKEAFETAHDRERRGEIEPSPEPASDAPRSSERSPDWLLNKRS